MKVANIRVVIMCKAPVAGRVKTRLTTVYSKAEAAELHAAMATTVIERAKRLFDDVVIAADDPDHLFFAAFGLPVTDQGQGSLGERMQAQVLHAFSDGGEAVLLLGTDSPHMSDDRLMQAAEAVKQFDLVIGPVEDGGYDLITMKKAHALFDGIDWSTARVLEQTMTQIRQLGLSCKQLETGFDVDEPEDVTRAQKAGWQL